MAGMWIVTFVTVSFIARHRYGGVLKSDNGHEVESWQARVVSRETNQIAKEQELDKAAASNSSYLLGVLFNTLLKKSQPAHVAGQGVLSQ